MSIALAQSAWTSDTLRLDEGAPRPTATIADLAWLAGSWHGSGFDGAIDEIWSTPAAGQMVGLFRLVKDGHVAFTEHMVLIEHEGSVELRVKHFSPAFEAWEDKAEFVRFPLVRLEATRAHFHGLTIERRGADAIVLYLVMTSRSGAPPRQVVLEYRRAGSAGSSDASEAPGPSEPQERPVPDAPRAPAGPPPPRP